MKALEYLCGKPVYKSVSTDNRGNQIVRPVYKLPERALVRR